MIKENLDLVHHNIEEACKRSNRNVSDVTLICVSKTKPVDMIQKCIDNSEFYFGENKVQELTSKYEYFDSVNAKLHWQLIGHLQTNKVKYIIDKAELIHSVDSLKLAKQIDTEARKKNVLANILIEVNIANEGTKFGVGEEECINLIENISLLDNVRVKGLMTIAPFVEDPEENRVYFTKMNKLFVDIKSKNIDNVFMETLSMGMTNDYIVAIEEGATMVRVGTGIFGERQYNIN